MKTVCPLCGSAGIEELLTLHKIPYFQNRLCESELQARHDGCGTQSMMQCQHCGFVFNRAFDPENVIYGSGYHAERSTSVYFNQHLKNVAEQIDAAYALKGKRVLEVACGTGEFLRAIAKYEPQACIGVDPSADEIQGSITIHSRLFDEIYLDQYSDSIDILISRHMIEHIENPLEMLRLFGKALPEAAILYLETPRLDWILKNHVFYDFSYEHCSYYTDAFMIRLLTAAGFSLMEMRPSFDGQYFSILARKEGEGAELAPAGMDELERVRLAFRETKNTYLQARERFSAPSSCTGTGCKGVPPLHHFPLPAGVYLWGAGGKGVMCCNLLDGGRILGCIDKNPFKQGKFIPGTGHKVIAPMDVTYEKAPYILVENDVYFEEIEKEAKKIDERIQVFSLNELLGILPC